MTILNVAFSLALILVTVDGEDRQTVFPVAARPEGITEGPGSTLFVGQILSGSVLSIDALTGETKEVVGAQTNRQAWGLWYYMGAIFVAGGGPSFGGGVPEVYVYSAETGESLVTCAPLGTNEFGAFLNDVTVRDKVAYITDSVNGKLMAMDADLALMGNCSVWEIDLPDIFDPIEKDDFGANGVVSYSDGLLVCHEFDGSVWYVTNLIDDSTQAFQMVIANGTVPGADGLTVLNDRLYVTQNTENLISVHDLAFAGVGVTASRVGELTSSLFDTPATSAVYDGYIYSTNSRFANLPEISEPANDTVIGVLNTFAQTTTEEPTPGPTTSHATSTFSFALSLWFAFASFILVAWSER